MTAIVWFRQDLRVEDNPALFEACQNYKQVLPVYIWAPEEEGAWAPGGASKWWIHHSLESLDRDLQKIGLNLTIRVGSSQKELEKLIKETDATAVFWNRRYEPSSIERDKKIKANLKIKTESFNGSLLWEPWTICNGSGNPYKVFTPYYKACLADIEPTPPLAIPKKSSSPKVNSVPIAELNLLPRIHWDAGMQATWKPSTEAAKKRLNYFLDKHVDAYSTDRDFPAIDGVSNMAPFLHHGNISARMIWHATSVQPFARQLVWREFAHHLLYHFPHTPEKPLRPEFENFPWKYDDKALHAWQKGLTGYPIVDAGMRQLWKIGYMHNRLRMIVGSFLVKDLLLPWNQGAAWFWDTLCDADLANNTLGWQWVGGCGADAAPYFRIFNPITQGEKFDPDGAFVREWVPELKGLSNEWIHKPWEAPPLILRAAGITLGKDYPFPLVDHSKARLEALAALEKIKK
jgi:deoxyribodipyrimidine photo-lyase